MIDDNHFLLVWADAYLNCDGNAQVLTINTSTWDVSTAGALFEFDGTHGYLSDAIQVDSNHFLVAWYGVNEDGYAVVLDVNTSTWNITTANDQLEFDTQNGFFPFLTAVDSNHFLCTWGGGASNYYNAQVFEVNTSTYAITTAGSSLEFGTQVAHKAGAVLLNGNLYLHAGRHGDTETRVNLLEINTSTYEITTKTDSFVSDTDDGEAQELIRIDDWHAIMTWHDKGGGVDGKAVVLEVNSSTYAISTAASEFTFDAGGNYWGGLAEIRQGKYIIVYSPTTTSLKSVVLSVDTSSYEVTTAGAVKALDSVQSCHTQVRQIDSSHYLWMGSGSGEDGYVQVLEVDVPEPPPGPGEIRLNFSLS
jgi:hypothetical protein